MDKLERVSIIVALSKTRRAIGNNNQLLWRLPGDLPRLKKLTMGHPLIMGRKTFESIGRPLPGRTNIVLSRNADFHPEGVVVCSDLQEAMRQAASENTKESFIFGGAKVYEMALPFVNRLYLTVVDDEPEADAFFPEYSEFKKQIEKEPHPELSPAFEYLTLERS